MSKRLLVTGGRRFHNYRLVFKTLDAIKEVCGFTGIIHGGCETGVDWFAGMWAQLNHVPVDAFPVSNKSCKAEYGERNAWMVQHEKPAFAVVFPGGRGTVQTRELIEKAKMPFISLRESAGCVVVGCSYEGVASRLADLICP